MTPSTPIRMLAFGLLLGLAASSYSDTTKSQRLALKGYDPVAYFTVGKPLKGDSRFAYEWDDGRYHFANSRHRDLFVADPERYAPRFSGFCTGAVISGARYEADPEIWTIVDDKLFLFSGRAGRERFERNPSIELAEKAWRDLK